MRSSLDMGNSQFNIIIAKLRRNGIIINGGINKKYIPNVEFDSGQHRLILIFDFNDSKKEESNIQG